MDPFAEIELQDCPQCGGTGMWYNPSVYYDFTMNMMMGQYQGCPACGGAGS